MTTINGLLFVLVLLTLFVNWFAHLARLDDEITSLVSPFVMTLVAFVFGVLITYQLVVYNIPEQVPCPAVPVGTSAAPRGD